MIPSRQVFSLGFEYSLTLSEYSIIYFDINSLPSTEGDYVTLTLNWTKLDGEAASQQYRFKSRQ